MPNAKHPPPIPDTKPPEVILPSEKPVKGEEQPVLAPTKMSWIEHAVENDVCNIPSSLSNLTREDILRDLADSVVESLDLTIDPCSDFYQFACGGWLKRNNVSTIPKEVSSWAKSFSTIERRNERILAEGEKILNFNKREEVE